MYYGLIIEGITPPFWYAVFRVILKSIRYAVYRNWVFGTQYAEIIKLLCFTLKFYQKSTVCVKKSTG